MDVHWSKDLDRWLEPFTAALGHKTRARMCPAYVAGLIGPGDRKSIQPMAARDMGVSYDQLHHFIGSGSWDAAGLEAALLIEADRMLGGDDACLIVDDTALPKKGRHSVGVARQYASTLGKNANCQTMVSLTLASNEVPVTVGLRLFLPGSWTDDADRLARAVVPGELRGYRTKREIALAEIDRVRATGVRFGCVLADAGHGLSAGFRQALSERGLRWAVGIPRHQKVYPADVAMIVVVAGRGRARQRHTPDTRSIDAQATLEHARWQKISWRRGTKGRLAARFAALRVRVADGPTQRIHDMGAQRLPGEEVSGCRRASLDRRTQVLPLQPSRRDLGQAAYRCDQGPLGVRAGASAAEGGTGPRPLRGTLMDRPAPTRVDDDDRLRVPASAPPHTAGWGKKNHRTTTPANTSRDSKRHPRRARSSRTLAMPPLSQMAHA